MEYFYIILFVIAFLYAAVGHGGASGYLALMALYHIAPEEMKPTALLLNLFVSGISFFQYYRGKHFLWKTFLPFALGSIPFSFLGGMIILDGSIYKKILGFLLLLPVVRMLFFPNPKEGEMKSQNFYLSLMIGATIGFISGMIGIGGGIILSPVLLLLKWTNQKQTAAISALFIFVNSISGLAGQFTKGIIFSSEMVSYVLVALAGGIFGAYFGALKFNQTVLKNLLGIVLLLAAVKLIIGG